MIWQFKLCLVLQRVTSSVFTRKHGQSKWFRALRGLSDDDPLKKNYVYFLMLEAIDIFEDAVKSEKLPKARKEIIEKLQKVLEVAEQVGVE